jgi:competence protein ComEC
MQNKQMQPPAWKQAPFIRLLAAFVPGILLQYYGRLPLLAALLPVLAAGLLLAVPKLLPGRFMLHLKYLRGAALLLLVLAAGMALTSLQNIKNSPAYLGNQYQQSGAIKLTLTEPLSEKAKTWKATASITEWLHNDTVSAVTANVIVYFKKQAQRPAAGYGSVIIFKKPIQSIRNSGNPGAFDYERQSLFKGITHQVFLDSGEYVCLNTPGTHNYKAALYQLQDNLLQIIRQHVPGEKEKGIAEALLIGYRDDLDKTLVEAYSNTGTIHIIAISGLHLGMIYMILLLLLKPLEKTKAGRVLKPVIVLSVLWLFTLLAGGAPSIMRSAIMFSCILLGEVFNRNTSAYNTLAASAFLLLCINPFNLWDVGFQLSYSAVLSIMVFMNPVYNLLDIKNKWLDYIWKLNAVTIAAQILTLPVIIFHFHQFPNLFLITNFIAVPLSSIILAGELLLVALAWLPWLAAFIGKALSWLIGVMNGYIEWCGGLSFSTIENLQMNVAECICLYAVIIAAAAWLMQKNKKALTVAFISLFAFGSMRLYAHWKRNARQQVIVYNVPRQQAVDFIDGGHYVFQGDSVMREKGFLRNFHLKPARIELGVTEKEWPPEVVRHPFYIWQGKTVLLLDSAYRFNNTSANSLPVDVLVLSRNVKLRWNDLTRQFNIKQVVADATNSGWKLRRWQQDCDSLHLPFYAVAGQGAFVLNCGE